MKYLLLLIALIITPLVQASAVFSELGPDARKHLDVTVFNNGLAVVRDRREIVMPTGDVDLEFPEVALSIVPETVNLSSDHDKGFVARRQSYRYDLLNRQSLLERFVGRKVKYSRTVLEEGNFEKFLREGILLSLNPEIVQFGDVIEVEPIGTISLPYIPDDLKTTPTLVFNGTNNKQGEQVIDVRYHAREISWEADYAMLLDKRGSLEGWVTVRNHSGTAMAIDHLSLVAGDLNIHAPSHPVPIMERHEAASVKLMADRAAGPPPEAVGDYHVYDFAGGVSLLKNDMTQLRLMSAEKIRYKREYRLNGAVQRYQQPAAQDMTPGVWVSFDNSRGNSLGDPLPAGMIRFYESHDESQIFLGESRISHTPAGESLSLYIGQAFDLRATRTQTDYRRLGERAAEAEYTISVRNSSNGRRTIQLEEQISGDWEMIKQNHKGQKTDATTYVFSVDVGPGKTESVTYRVRLNW